MLPEIYKQCNCGEKLTKRNRFAVKLEVPSRINTDKREKEGKKYCHGPIVIYCCELCYWKMHDLIPPQLGTNDWYYYYHGSYPV